MDIDFGDVLLAAGVVVGAVAVYKYAKRQRSPEQILANPQSIQTGSVVVYNKEQSDLNPKMTLIRKQNPDGGITTYKLNTSDLTAWQNYLVTKNWFVVKNDTLKQDLPWWTGVGMFDQWV
jgi:hypothetical protein